MGGSYWNVGQQPVLPNAGAVIYPPVAAGVPLSYAAVSGGGVQSGPPRALTPPASPKSFGVQLGSRAVHCSAAPPPSVAYLPISPRFFAGSASGSGSVTPAPPSGQTGFPISPARQSSVPYNFTPSVRHSSPPAFPSQNLAQGSQQPQGLSPRSVPVSLLSGGEGPLHQPPGRDGSWSQLPSDRMTPRSARPGAGDAAAGPATFGTSAAAAGESRKIYRSSSMKADHSEDPAPQENQRPVNGEQPQPAEQPQVQPEEILAETPLRKGMQALRQERERQRLAAEQLRAQERLLKQAAAEQRQAEAERLRLEVERQRAEGRRTRQEQERKKSEAKESIAEDVRQAAEDKRRAKAEEAFEVERKRFEAQRAREEAERRLSRGRRKITLEKQKQAEETRRRLAEELKSQRTTAPPGAGRGSTPGATARKSTQTSPMASPPAATPEGCDGSPRARRDSSPASPRRFLASQGVTGRRGAGIRTVRADKLRQKPEAGKRQRGEEQRRRADDAARRRQEAEAERERQEEAERQRIRLEQMRSKAAESSARIAAAGVDWHCILGVEPSASLAEIKLAFRDLALLHHPDKGFENCDDTFRVVRGAYQRALHTVSSLERANDTCSSPSATWQQRPATAR